MAIVPPKEMRTVNGIHYRAGEEYPETTVKKAPVKKVKESIKETPIKEL